jgi:hypothetical protein
MQSPGEFCREDAEACLSARHCFRLRASALRQDDLVEGHDGGTTVRKDRRSGTP